MNNFNTSVRKRITARAIKRQLLSHIHIVRFVILGLFLIFLSVLLYLTVNFVKGSVVGTFVRAGRNFVAPQENKILTDNGRVNILLMGKGGADHDAPDLTDTMMVASISIPSKKITLISIPRDIWIPSLTDKVNSAYMYGKVSGGNKTGIILAKSTISDILGEPISYGIVVDFSSFEKVIDAIGGIQVDVQNSFTDNQYPIAGRENDKCNGDSTFACRYETITFSKGMQHMDGATALKFVRSRHASGIEGNDVAREARQQLVLSSIFKKLVTAQVFTNIAIDQKLLGIATHNIETDMKIEEAATIARYAYEAKNNIKSSTIPDNLLFNPTNEYLYHNEKYSHAFVFIPARRDGKWTDVQQWVSSVLP